MKSAQRRKAFEKTEPCMCGGGISYRRLISHKLTEVPGCSEVLQLAITGYSNAAKEKVLGVSGST